LQHPARLKSQPCQRSEDVRELRTLSAFQALSTTENAESTEFGRLGHEEHFSVWVAVFGDVLGLSRFFETKRLRDGDGEFTAGDVVG